MSITIKDIARMADVSIATVSRVINHKNEGVSEETRSRILRIVKETDYYPNRIARGLVTKKTNILGLILPDITNPFFPGIARGVEDTASKYGYNIILCNSDNKSEKEETYINILTENNVDGIICTSVTGFNNERMKKHKQKKIPFVFLDRSLYRENIPVVYSDGTYGMYEMVKYVIKEGHRRIAYISGPEDNSSSAQRMTGYRQAIQMAGIPYDPDIVAIGSYQIKDGNECMRRLLESGHDFTAVVCANDLMAVGALDELKSREIKVPEEISITGYDDIYAAGITSPKLTTVAQPVYEMGCYAVEQLVGLIRGEKLVQSEIRLKPELIIRQSVSKRGDMA